MAAGLRYTGVGSRKTPDPMLVLMEALAVDLRERKYVCRTGHADHADYAFESGAGGRVELYLPWQGFNGPFAHPPDFTMTRPTTTARDIAMVVHPAWDRLNRGGRLLHARNVHQVLGADLVDVNGEVLTLTKEDGLWTPSGQPATPSEFLLCWTEGGRVIGGTATAIRLAQAFGVPVYNLWFAHERARFETDHGLRVVA